MPKHRLSFAALTAVAPTAILLSGGLLAVLPAQAANDAWSTAPASGNFSGLNWTPGTTPGTPTITTANGDSLYFGTSSVTTLTNDTNFTYSGLTFNSGAAAFTIGGNSLGLSGNVTNNSTSAQTISGFSVGSGSTVNFINDSRGGGGLTVSGTITGSGNVTYVGNTSGSAFVLSGNNSGFTGTFTGQSAFLTRIHFNTANSGSAGAAWVFNLPDGQNNGPGFYVGNGTISFGSLAGQQSSSSIFNNIGNSITTLSVGALNTNTSFGQSISIQKFGSNIQNMALTKVGTGDLTLTGSNNTFSGGTIVTDGALSLGAAHAAGEGSVTIDTGGQITVTTNNALGGSTATTAPTLTTMSGGTLLNANASATSAASNAQYGGNLVLTTGDTSTLDFGAANKGALFNFTGLGTGTGILDVTNYLGTPAIGGGLDQLFVGTTKDLTSAQLAQFNFEQNGATLGAATQLANGEVTYIVSAAPEPAQVGIIALMAFGLGGLLLTAKKRNARFMN